MSQRLIAALLPTFVALMLSTGGRAFAADPYPDRIVKLIVPFAAGGPGDAIARAAADAL